MRRIITAILVLIGFGSCCNRPSKSKTLQENPAEAAVSADTTSIPPMRVMYGPPRPGFNPERIRQAETAETPSETTTNETATEE